LHLEINGPAQVLAVAADGIYRCSAGNWEKFTPDPMPADFVPLKIFPDRRGRLWITGARGRVQGGARSALAVFEGRHAVNVPVPSLCESYASLNIILFDQNGEPYLLSPAGLYHYGISGWQPVSLPIERGSLSAAAWDAAGRLWIAGRDHGLFVRERAAWRELLFGENPAPGGITSISFDHDATLWLGTANQGVLRIELKTKTP
jgi:ligand-binding sensor domain-containing protein